MHADPLNLNIEELANTRPLRAESSVETLMKVCITIGACIFLYGLFTHPTKEVWGAYYTSLLYFMGMACGSVMIAVIVQIVRATWVVPVRRIAEAGSAFLPWAFVLWLCTWFGRGDLFPWGAGTMPGREWWMRPEFVYLRFTALFLLLFGLMIRYVQMSVRSCVGFVRERAADKKPWLDWEYDFLLRGWKGSEVESIELQRKMSWNAPLLVVVYCVVYSLFAFEMVMGMNTIWYSNMFGGFYFIGNIYMGWAVTILLTVYFLGKSQAFAKTVGTQQLWDLGKLTFGFCMLWGYLFLSQFLPQWYGNLPEETQWLILRTRELPWRPIAYTALAMCFVLPFVMLVSEDLKKTPPALASVAVIILLGMWVEKYVVVMPELSPAAVPFGVIEVGIFFGFLGIYVLSVLGFLKKYPFTTLSHPQAREETDW